MEKMVEKIITEQKQKTVSLLSLEVKLKKQLGNNISPWFYKKLADAIIALEDKGIIEPFNNAKLYSRDTRVKERYKKKQRRIEDEKELKQEILTSFHPKISVLYYLGKPEEFRDVREKVKDISRFIQDSYEKQPYLSTNERSYELFGDEKYLASENGRKLLSNLKLTFDDLCCFETFEPFFHIGFTQIEKENILIVENKDTFFSLKKLFLKRIRSWSGIEFSMLIYGEGNKITKSFEYLNELEVPIDTNIYYFGDFDPEGIAIYHRLTQKEERTINIMKLFYEKMFDERKDRGVQKKQKWNKEAIETFFKENEFRNGNLMKEYLAAGKYVPQEAVNIELLRRMADVNKAL